MAGVSRADAPEGRFRRLRAEAEFHLRFYAALGVGVLVFFVTAGQHLGLRMLLAADVFFALFIGLMLLEAIGLDEAGLRRNMRHYTDGLHVDGIFCTGTMGEFWALTKEERKRAVEIVVEEAHGKCKVIAHTGHHSPNETIDLTLHAQHAGAAELPAPVKGLMRLAAKVMTTVAHRV